REQDQGSLLRKTQYVVGLERCSNMPEASVVSNNFYLAFAYKGQDCLFKHRFGHWGRVDPFDEEILEAHAVWRSRQCTWDLFQHSAATVSACSIVKFEGHLWPLVVINPCSVARAEHIEAGGAVVHKMVVMPPMGACHHVPCLPVLGQVKQPEVAVALVRPD